MSGDWQRHGIGCRRLAHARKPNRPVLRHGAQTAAEIERFRAVSTEREDLLRLAAGEWPRPLAGGSLRQPAKDEAADRCRSPTKVVQWNCRPAAQLLQCLIRGLLHEL